MKFKKASIVLLMILSLAACGKNNSGDNNKSSEEGNIYHGNGVPSDSLGKDYSHYYDEDSRYVYEKKEGKWINQLTIGSSALYQSKKISRALSSDTSIQELKDALMMSFYSTNATCFMNGYKDGSAPTSGSYANTKLNGRNVETMDRDGGHAAYIKLDEDGVPYVYTDGEYVKNEFFAVELPHPTYDNLAYEAMLIYDDELGEQTSIVCGNLDKATYDSETGYYNIENINIHHDARTTLCFTEPTEDNMTLNFKFKLSSDKTYVEYAEIKVVKSDIGYFDNLITSYSFSNLHTTSFEMPEWNYKINVN